jgi:hypothetical protein
MRGEGVFLVGEFVISIRHIVQDTTYVYGYHHNIIAT